jgi:CHAT domain-containing protein
MGPLVEALTQTGVDRAVLIPQGWLGLLPLHAAWIEQDGSRRYALDEVRLTYTPNARTLITARQTAARVAGDALLAVDEPWPVSGNPLRNSPYEVASACEHYAPASRKVLAGEAATEPGVRELLPDYPVLHFSCHGIAGFVEPLEGGLVMAGDEMLTLRDILALRLENTRLAVLSACETGIAGTDLPDEVISLPAGLVQAGVAGVVASLWSVSDLSTMLLMARFYEFWKQKALAPAEALRQSQIWVRDSTNGEKLAFVKNAISEVSAGRLPGHVAEGLYQQHRIALEMRADERDFAHPFHWAAFGYTGV